jgi:hypothetical protein
MVECAYSSRTPEAEAERFLDLVIQEQLGENSEIL